MNPGCGVVKPPSKFRESFRQAKGGWKHWWMGDAPAVHLTANLRKQFRVARILRKFDRPTTVVHRHQQDEMLIERSLEIRQRFPWASEKHVRLAK